MKNNRAFLNPYLLTLLIVVISFSELNAQFFPNIQATVTDNTLPAETLSGTTLFTTLGNTVATPVGVTSQDFNHFSGYKTTAADDFTVTGFGWTINEVQVHGVFYNPNGGSAGPAESVNIYILSGAGIPGSTDLSASALFVQEDVSYKELGNGDLLIPIAGSGITLSAGVYWIVVQVNMDFDIGGQWFWCESSSAANSGTPLGTESAWFQENYSFINGGCVSSWGNRLTSCGVGDNNAPKEYDLAFALGGTQLSAGINISRSSMSLVEDGNTEVYQISLDAPPQNNQTVTVNVASGDVTEGTVSVATRTFGVWDWNISQNVTVTPGVSGDGNDGDVTFNITHSVNATVASGYNGEVAPSISVTNQNIDGVGAITVSKTYLSITEGGTSGSFDLQLTGDPTNDVTVVVAADGNTQVSLDNSSFGNSVSAVMSNTTAVPVYVKAKNNSIDQDDYQFTLTTNAATSGDGGYDGYIPVDIGGLITDDDNAGVTVNPTFVTTSEDGTLGNFTVKLNTQPTANVTVDLTVSDNSEGTISIDAATYALTRTLTFTPGDWSSTKTVNVKGTEDFINDGNKNWIVMTVPCQSTDAKYKNIDATDVDVTTTNISYPPTGADGSVNPGEDFDYPFQVNDFVFNDIDNHSFAGIKLISTPTEGSLFYQGGSAAINTNYPDVTKFVFKPEENGVGLPYATFTFKVLDSSGASSTATYTMSINIENVSDIPVVSVNSGATVSEGGVLILSDLHLKGADADGHSYSLIYNITRAPAYGALTKNSALMKADSTETSSFTQNDIANGKVKYTHDGSETDEDFFKFTVEDEDGNTCNEETFAITVDGVNDAPTVAVIDSITMLEDEEYNLDLTTWYDVIIDIDDPDTTLTISVSCSNVSVTLSPKDDNSIMISAEENYFGDAKLNVTISDGELECSTTVDLIIESVNDLPTITGLPSSLTLQNGDIEIIYLTGLAEDVETPDSLLVWSYSASPDSLVVFYDQIDHAVVFGARGSFEGSVEVTVTVADEDGGTAEETITITFTPDPTGINDLNGIPTEFELSQNYPNPFNPTTVIRYGIPSDAQFASATNITLRVYDILGNLVVTLQDGVQSPGFYERTWKAGNISSGIYFYMLNAGDYREIRKMILLK